MIDTGKQINTASDGIGPPEAVCLESIDVQALSCLTIFNTMCVNA